MSGRPMSAVGSVRVTRRGHASHHHSELSGSELLPFSERNSAGLFVYFSAIEVPILTEVVVD